MVLVSERRMIRLVHMAIYRAELLGDKKLILYKHPENLFEKQVPVKS